MKSRTNEIQQTSSKLRKVSLEQITSIHEFAKNVDRIVPPNQLAAIFKNRFLQHFISLDPNSIIFYVSI